MDILLTPAGHLRWEDAKSVEASAALRSVGDAFRRDWPGGLFTLAAEKVPVHEWPCGRYWQRLAEHYVTALCHVPEGAEDIDVPEPGAGEYAEWLLTAPPMRGGEYLTEDILRNIWSGLDAWVRRTAAQAGGLPDFLRKHAPKWHRVGRVCFHLAENGGDDALPFAFMATYAAGFGASGRLRHLPLRRALEQYAGAKDRKALVRLLSPIRQAAETCDWVGDLVDSGDIYRPVGWPPAKAYRFLLSVEELERSGLTVSLPDWWRRRPRPYVSVTVGTKVPSRVGVEAMLDFDVEVVLGDQQLPADVIAALLEGDDGLVLLKGQWVEVDRGRLREAIDHWEAMRRQAADGEISFVEGMRLLAGASADLSPGNDGDGDERNWVRFEPGEAMREVLASLREPGGLAVGADDGLKGTLRPYQSEGVGWLRFVTELGLGACLADDMGLGKTIQVLALLLSRRRGGGGGPSLLVVPASVLGNWRREAQRFAPDLRMVFLHPSETGRETLERIADAPEEHLGKVDLAVTTYAMLVRQEWLGGMSWDLVILDEAQAVRNPSTRQSRAVRRLSAGARIALTGTPVENRLGDLWALFDFLNPGLLGSRKTFGTFVKAMGDRDGNDFGPLRRLVGPYILRRLKTDRHIITDLPDKTETVSYCHLTPAQIRLYGSVIETMRRGLADTDGIARKGLVLKSLLRLKQVCNHPSQLSGDNEYAPRHSGKFGRLTEICTELAERQERVLVFTQFREVIDPIAEHLAGVFGRPGLVLHGGTRVKGRGALVERFGDEDGPPFFVLSLKAGGTGLNLTAASHVIHFDRWWNPAVENQATDRAFRIGQKRNVFVHKFVTAGTVEERIDQMIADKRELAEDILGGDAEINLTELSDDALFELVRFDVTRASA